MLIYKLKCNSQNGVSMFKKSTCIDVKYRHKSDRRDINVVDMSRFTSRAYIKS